MLLWLRTIRGQALALQCAPEHSIAQIRALVSGHTQVPPMGVLLIGGGELLTDHSRLGELSYVSHGSSLHL
eukprot:12276785-Prorocentrum_lima.AAC.1